MEEKTLLMVAVLCFCAGFSVILLVYENASVEETSVVGESLDEDVMVKGAVKKAFVGDGVTFIEIEKPQNISVVFFEELNVSGLKEAEITGRVSKYNDGFEIIGKEIKKI